MLDLQVEGREQSENNARRDRYERGDGIARFESGLQALAKFHPGASEVETARFNPNWSISDQPGSEVGNESRACALWAPNLLLRPLGGAKVRTSHTPESSSPFGGGMLESG